MSGAIPEEKHSAVSEAQERVTTLSGHHAPLRETLEELVRIVESVTASGMIGSILLLDQDARRLRHGGAPSLPDEYNAAIDGIEIGPNVGSCGTAAHDDRTVVVYDIANDELWANFRDLALKHGLRACWSTPIHGSDGRVLGTFANYYRVVRDPSPSDVRLTELITRTAADAIEEHRPLNPPATRN